MLAACDPAGGPASLGDGTVPAVDPGAPAQDGLEVAHRLIAAGEPELAIRAFYRTASRDGLNADILSGLGSANLMLGRLGQAERLLRDAVEREPDFAQAWNNLGVVLMERGQTAEAVLVFRRAFALSNGDSDEIRDNLRLALSKSDQGPYSEPQKQSYKLVRRGTADFLIRETP